MSGASRAPSRAATAAEEHTTVPQPWPWPLFTRDAHQRRFSRRYIVSFVQKYNYCRALLYDMIGINYPYGILRDFQCRGTLFSIQYRSTVLYIPGVTRYSLFADYFQISITLRDLVHGRRRSASDRARPARGQHSIGTSVLPAFRSTFAHLRCFIL